MSRRRQRFVLVGPGRVGLALGAAWVARGHRCVGVYGSTPDRRRRARNLLAVRTSGREHPDFDLLLITTPDRAIQQVARAWAAAPISWRGKLALHTAGALPASALAPLRRRGASVAALHPLMSISSLDVPPQRFRGVFFGIDGDPGAARLARLLVRGIGGVPLPVAARSKPAYHLAACLASGHLLALLGGAVELLSGAGVPEARARRALLRLARTSLDNAERNGIGRALTGPAVRGDVATIRLHRRVLARRGPGLPEIYRWLSGELVREAWRSGRIQRRRAADTLKALIGKKRRRRK